MLEPENLGGAFQSKTSYRRNAIPERDLDWRSRPARCKFYPHTSVTTLPSPHQGAATSVEPDLWACVAKRRSVRSFSSVPMTLGQLSSLLWASAGTTSSYITPQGQDFYRAAPSAGALYPIETYLVVNQVESLEPGLYHYRPTGMDVLERPIVEGSHALEQLAVGDLSADIKRAAFDQPMCAKAGAVFIWSAVFPRSVWKYRDRAYRYVYLDAGHIAAHLSLAAVSLGLASCQIAAFYDDEANALLEIDGEEEGVLYMSAVGNSARPFGGAGTVDLRHTSRPKE
jgi:SagB-type dehydrogenase family enzyme